jgi:hypothetical protein
MSDIINGTAYNDPDLQGIRDQVATQNDGIPFLLLPVKIETRFMKVDRPVYETDVYPDILVTLFEMEHRIGFDPLVLPQHEILGKIRKLPLQLDDIAARIKDIKRFSGKEKEYLLSRSIKLENTHNKLSQALSQLSWKDEEKIRELRLLKNEMAQKVLSLKAAISELKPHEDTTFLEGTAFLNTLEEINDSLHTIARKKLSATDWKEKRQRFLFANDQLAKIESALKSARRNMNINMLATPFQLNRLTELKNESAGLFTKARSNIEKIKSDYKKIEYREKLNQLAANAEELHHGIDTRLKPKIEMKRDLATVSARDVLWMVLDIRFRLKQLNQHPFKSYEEIRSTRESLYASLHALRAEIHKIVEGSEEELKAISAGWDDADQELERFTQRVRSFKGVGRQKGGLSRTITHINEEYRKDLAGLKSTSKSYFTELNNIRLEKSAVQFNASLALLKTIKDDIVKNIEDPSSKNLKKLFKNYLTLKIPFPLRQETSMCCLRKDLKSSPAYLFSWNPSSTSSLKVAIKNRVTVLLKLPPGQLRLSRLSLQTNIPMPLTARIYFMMNSETLLCLRARR